MKNKSERPVDALPVKNVNYSLTHSLKSRDASASKNTSRSALLSSPDLASVGRQGARDDGGSVNTRHQVCGLWCSLSIILVTIIVPTILTMVAEASTLGTRFVDCGVVFLPHHHHCPYHPLHQRQAPGLWIVV